MCTCSELGLNKVADTMLGSARVRGVSGGEKKRANIGVELIKNPSILFLDEVFLINSSHAHLLLHLSLKNIFKKK
jgi:ABC-type multidrug transport system ATPase subunit